MNEARGCMRRADVYARYGYEQERDRGGGGRRWSLTKPSEHLETARYESRLKLLRRFEVGDLEATVDALADNGGLVVVDVDGQVRTGKSGGDVGLSLSAEDAVMQGRTVLRQRGAKGGFAGDLKGTEHGLWEGHLTSGVSGERS